MAMTISPSSTQPAGQLREQRVVQLGEVAVERPQVAALDVDVVAPRKTIARKPSHFGSNRKPSPVGQLVGELREHRLDRRRQRKHRRHNSNDLA